MEQGPTEQAIIQQCVKEKLPLPERIKNAPEVFLGLNVFYSAFLDLTSCRGTGYGTEGPIPWLAMVKWAELYHLSEDQFEDLIHHVSRMDAVYLKHKAEKLKSSMPRGKK